jgi:2-polyprenyl-6-hydroxyphenyl methylase/3-demethylubiquinone-9 3-methyltransferase
MTELRNDVAPADDRRFAFGDNWRRFLDRLDERRLAEAELSLKSLLALDDLRGLRFLDIGSGSGIFSLAARRLGARVRSFDYDQAAVECALILRQRYFAGDDQWTIGRGSVLDADFVSSLGTFDIVYSWGVLHHTGAMHRAIELAASRVKLGGLFAVALYRKTRFCFFWTREKRWYVDAAPWQQRAARSLFTFLLRLALIVRRRNFKQYVANYHSVRGMDYETDVHDWMGGYPYESIGAAEVLEFMRRLGFECIRSKTKPYSTGIFGSGCDEYVFRSGAPGA